MVRTFTRNHPPRNQMDEQEDAQLSEPGLNDFRLMPRNLFVGGAEQDQLSETDDNERTQTGYASQPEQFQVPTGIRQRHSRPYNSQHERPKRDAQPAAVVATRNSPTLSNIVVPTRPRGSGKLNNEPSSSKYSEELMRKNADLERQLRDIQKSIDELKSPRSHQQTLDLDSAPLNLSITMEPYQGGFKIPHLETYDGSDDPDEHLHTYQAIMRIQNANDAMMCKVFPATLKSTARRWYHKLPRHSIDSYSQLAKLFSNKFASQREIKRTTTELMQAHQKEGESLRDYMQRFNKTTLDIDNVPDTICLSALLHGLKSGRFIDDLLENPLKTWNEVNDRSQILAQIQHWVRRPPPLLHDSPRADKSKHCNYHRTYGHNTEDCQHLKDELKFLARNGKLEGYAQKPYTQQPSQTHFVQGVEHTDDVSSIGEDKDRELPPRTKKIGKGPLKRPFEEAEWENVAITFSPTDYKRAEGEPDIMMPHVNPFVATVHIGNHNINKVFIDTGSSPNILYWSCFQKMQLNPNSLQKHEGPIYGFDNQPVPVEGVITLPIYMGSEPRFRMASVSFLVVKMESTFNAILGRATLCELKAVISQPHLCMKFPTLQGVGVLKGNQKMARACYQDTFKKVELAAAPVGSEIHRLTQLGQQTMSISDIEHRPEGVEQKAEPVEPVEIVPLNPDVMERTVKIGTRLIEKEQAELLKFLRANQDVFAWTTDEMPSIPAELTVHKLSTDPTKRPMWRMCIDFTNLNEACSKDSHPLPNVEKLVERAAGHERMSFLDASLGYNQVQLLLDDQEKTAFYAGDAIYCYVMMLFGLKNASATYQKLDHIDDLSKTFQNLRQAQKKLNPLKCTFAVESGKFLGYVVSKKGIEVNPEKVQAVQQMEPPKMGESLYLYLGVTEEAVSSILLREENKNQKPICYVSNVLQDAKQNYPLAEKAAFAMVCTARKLRVYFKYHQIVVYTDLPLKRILQRPELSGRFIGWSVKLKKAPEHQVWVLYVDRAANVEGSGAGAVLVSPDGFKSETRTEVQSIQVFNDSQLVVGHVKGSCEIRDPQLGRYASVVNRLKSRFDSFQIDKIPRADNQRADELSKLASSQDVNPHRSTMVEVLDTPSYADCTVECQLLSTDPSSPSWTTPLIDYLCNGELPKDPSAAKLIKRKAAHFTLLCNQLYKRAASMPLLRCLTPYEAEYAVREVHEGVCGEMLSLLSSPWPFPQWGVDLLGPFVKGKGGCTYLVVAAVDYFTKWIEAKPLSTTKEKKIEEFLFNSILCRFVIPKRIIADNGPQFRAAALRSFCNDYGIELALTSVYTPQSNG
ncbi:hypothetical protein SLEP1_g28154 [Rubroshorea leprosula]|uniref:RNA-directed DNA polymerase n=1 Tax=Rubroshorea leprosula TaxID=152421 RepID=A0AAV5K469_9ROSI|nr:hypothetical protein SLEP1_g28154 [Rubroshorea leprosula]